MEKDATRIVRILTEVATVIERNKDYLCELDSEVGDGDHGVSMTIGMRTARKALAATPDAEPCAAFQVVSDAFADEVGAASGVMYEVAFAAAAQAVSGSHDLATAADWAAVFEAIAAAIQEVGQAQLGDKTMLDAWAPAAEALRRSAQSGDAPDSALAKATAAAWRGVQDTIDLVPKRGRASFLGERARGHQDAGATSAYLIVKAISDCMAP